MPPPRLSTLGHVALTVSDLAASVEWWSATLGFRVAFPYDTADFARRILVHPSGVVVALTQHDPGVDGPFDPRRCGLDHLGFGASSVSELEEWLAWLDERGVAHAGVQLTASTGSALVAFADPDGIALEVYVQTGPPTG